ncbi:hypothetical protein SRHO_G00157100 [Serrasalmus rhombeus]
MVELQLVELGGWAKAWSAINKDTELLRDRLSLVRYPAERPWSNSSSAGIKGSQGQKRFRKKLLVDKLVTSL